MKKITIPLVVQRWAYIIGAVIFILLMIIFCAYGVSEAKEKSDLSPSFLGIYQKAMRFYPEILKYSKKYDVDPTLILSIAMYESGGNENLTSDAGAKGLMQVMPATKKDMEIYGTDVSANIEAGVKYLKFVKEEMMEYYGEISGPYLKMLMIQSYHDGPERAKRPTLRRVSFQYLQGVSIFFNLLSCEKDKIEELAKDIKILVLEKPQTWKELAKKFNLSVIELRLSNPFLAGFYSGEIPKGEAIAYPNECSHPVIDGLYVSRRGDILRYISNVFDISCSELRERTNLLMWSPFYPETIIDVSDSPYL
ncbi:transglycosylase SLT domain-containing protein [Patescibacteria group bacterium]|nr:transglycosylase SLT domain-containing protein [Patescibacteria group bacterium]